MSETVTIEKKVFDVLQKNNLELIDKLNKTKECLKFYANGRHISSTSFNSSYSIKIEDGTKARYCLKEIDG